MVDGHVVTCVPSSRVSIFIPLHSSHINVMNTCGVLLVGIMASPYYYKQWFIVDEYGASREKCFDVVEYGVSNGVAFLLVWKYISILLEGKGLRVNTKMKKVCAWKLNSNMVKCNILSRPKLRRRSQ